MPDVGLQPTRARAPTHPLRGHFSLGRGAFVWEAVPADRPSLTPTMTALSYWRELGAGGRLPERRSIEPWRITNLLPLIFFARRHEPCGGWRYTLIGGCLEAVVGAGLTKRPLRQVYPGRRTAGGFSRLCSAVAADRTARITRAAICTNGDMPLEVPRRFNLETVHMPVLDGTGEVIIFGICAFDRPVRTSTANPSAL